MSPPMTSNTRSTPPTSSSGVVVEVDELLRAEVERRLPVGGASGADDVGAGLAGELRHHRSDSAGRTVHEDALPRLEAAVLEQSLPCGQARDRQARAHREVDVARQRREVTRLDGHVLRQGAVASPVREAEHPLAHRQPRRAIAESADHSGQLVPGDRRCPVPAEAIGPGRGPRQLTRGESRRMNLNERRRSPPPPARAAPPASSRPFPRPDPSPQSPSSGTSRYRRPPAPGAFTVFARRTAPLSCSVPR